MVLFRLLEGQGHSYNNHSKGKEKAVIWKNEQFNLTATGHYDIPKMVKYYYKSTQIQA
jgi:hypothetical protein